MLSEMEMAAVRKSFQAAQRFGKAEIALGYALESEGRLKDLLPAFEQVLRTGRDLGTVPFALLGGLQLDAGRAHAERARHDTLYTAIEFVQQAKRKGSEEVQKAQNLLMEAREALEQVDLSLPFADPPFEPENGPVRTVVGPHGDFFAFQRHLFAATHYWREWADHWLEELSYSRGPKKAFAEAFRLYAMCINFQLQAALLPAGISTYLPWDQLDQFCRALKALELLQSIEGGQGVPEFYHAATLSWSKVARGGKSYERSLLRLSDSWRNSDMAAWQLMVFPNSERCRIGG